MLLTKPEPLKVYPLDDRYYVHTPAGRGEELLIHLASHGVGAEVTEGFSFDLVGLKGDVDPRDVQTIVDQWER